MSRHTHYPPVGRLSTKELNWKQYEAYIFGSLQRLLPGATFSNNVKMRGLKTGRLRQLDILIERDLGGFRFSIVVDCKSYARKVNVNDVERFLGMLGDLRISKGVLMTSKGYTKTAYQRAEHESRDIDLRILTAEQLSQFQSIGGAMPWNGPVAAIVSAPETWVVDNEHSPLLGSANPSDMPQFTMYPLGHTRESALQREAFVYGKIILKSPDKCAAASIRVITAAAGLPPAWRSNIWSPMTNRPMRVPFVRSNSFCRRARF